MAASTSVTSNLIGDLTTRYAPPATGCNGIFFAVNPGNPQGWYVRGSITRDVYVTSCVPPGFNRDARYFYSPGVCPLGYNIACTSYGTNNGVLTTTATCCPSGYVCFSNPGIGNIYACSSLFQTVIQNVVLPSINYEEITVPGKTKYPIIVSSVTTDIAPGESVRCYGVIVERQSTDPDFTITAGPSSSTADPNTPTTINLSDSGGLSQGDKINLGVGVGVGIGIGLPAFIVAILKLCSYLRR
ncbi:hypothetical protein F4782DRAFT_493367 [Xylaria castorea]|nr:hypothetical protein F4782DRAFT_493367 [Xylaria castorea]